MELRHMLAVVATAAALAACGHATAPTSSGPGSGSATPSASSSGPLRPSAYPADLAAAVHTRGFDLSPIGSHSDGVRVGVRAALEASAQFRPPGVPVAIHLARVLTPRFASLDFSSASHGSTPLFARAAAWLVVYDGQEAGQQGTWVVFVDARSGEAKAMVGFGAGLQGGAPCPNNRCIFE